MHRSVRGLQTADAHACRCFPAATPHMPVASACSNAAVSFCMLAELSGGQSTSVIMAASYPRARRVHARPTCRELNWPRSGAGFCTIAAPFAATTDVRSSAFASGHNNDGLSERPQGCNRRREQSPSPVRLRIRRGRRPGKQRLIAPHARSMLPLKESRRRSWDSLAMRKR